MTSQTTSEDKMQCPFCGEEIYAVALRCRYCGEWLKRDETISEAPDSNVAGNEPLLSTKRTDHVARPIGLYGAMFLGGGTLLFMCLMLVVGARTFVEQQNRISPQSSKTPTPRATATYTPEPPTSTPTPLGTPTESERRAKVQTLLAQIDAPWGTDWPAVIDLLVEARYLDPSNQTVADKLYVAYYNYGQALLKDGRKVAAAAQFQNALYTKPNGVEAMQAALNLTPSPTPGLSLSEQQALATLVNILSKLGDNIGEVAELLYSPRFYDSSWRTSIAFHMANVKFAYSEVNRLKVPSRVEPLRQTMLSATQDCAASMDSLAIALDNINSTAMQRSINQMQSCTTKTKRMQVEIDKLKQQLQ